MREKEGFREQLERLDVKFPDRELIKLSEASRLLGMHRITLTEDKGFPKKRVKGRWMIPKVALARWLA